MKITEAKSEISPPSLNQQECRALDKLIHTLSKELPNDSEEIRIHADQKLQHRLDARSDSHRTKPEETFVETNVLGRIIKELQVEGNPDRFSEAEQIRRLSDYLKSLDVIKHESWKNQPLEYRKKAMQAIENMAAEIGGRPSFDVIVEKMPYGARGGTRWSNKLILVNESLVASDREEDLRQTLKTLVHEGRHVYQLSNVAVKRTEPNDEKYKAYVENLSNNLFTAQEHGFKLYLQQPIEVDARVFSESVISKTGL